jgi:hypothetical protein
MPQARSLVEIRLSEEGIKQETATGMKSQLYAL